MIAPSPLYTSSQSSSPPIDRCFFQELKNLHGSLLAKILLEGGEEMAEGAAWIVVVGDEVDIRTVLIAMDMGTATATVGSTLRHHTSPRTRTPSLAHHTLRPSKDSEGMAPAEGRLSKAIIIITLASRVVVRRLEVPLLRVGCRPAVVVLLVVAHLVMEILRPILTPLINPHTAAEAILVGLVGTVATMEGMVDKQIMDMGATVARQAVAVMVAQEDKIAMAATEGMEIRMADRVVVGMGEVTAEEVTITLQGGEDEDSRLTYAYRLNILNVLMLFSFDIL
jgi:hypothetical protein